MRSGPSDRLLTMIKPLAAIDCNSEERRLPHEPTNALRTCKRPVTNQSAPPAAISLVSNMPDSNALSLPFDWRSISCPLQILAKTLESSYRACITTIDIAQAYQTLYNGLRLSIDAMVTVTLSQDPVATLQIRDEMSTLVKCLRRDINEGLQFFSHSHPAFLSKSSTAGASFTSTLQDPDIQMSTDASLLCQSALRVSSLLMMVPAFYTLISDAERTILLHPIIEICLERNLSIIDHKKVQSLAFSCMRTDAACTWVRSSQWDGLLEAIALALDPSELVDMRIQALKTIRHFLQNDPTRHIQSLSMTLSKVLAVLAASSGIYRTEAVATLCAFASAKCHVVDTLPDVIFNISTEVHDFLAQHKSRRKSVGDDHLLPGILREAINGDGALWAHNSLAALVILGDAHIFSHPRSLRLILDALRYSSRHKTPTVAHLHTEVWKCLVWALARCFTMPGEGHLDSRMDTYQRAFQLLTQEMRPGIGTRLVCVLMQNYPVGDDKKFRAWTIEQAVNILEQLMKHKSSRCFQEGLVLFSCLVGGSGSSEDSCGVPDLRDYIRPVLVNGSWAHMSLSEVDKSLNEEHPVPLSFIHSFTESEVQIYWERLSEAWATAVARVQSALTSEILDQLTRIWQSLILSQAQLTQGQTHLSASALIANKFATMTIRCISATAEPHERIIQLGLVRKWWNVLKNVFDRAWLSVPAGVVLNGILERSVDISNDQVREIWSEVCSELISTGISTLLHVLRDRLRDSSRGTASEERLALRTLWSLYGRHCVRVSSENDWADLVSLLSLPFAGSEAWALTEEELDIWKQIFAVALLAAEQGGISEVQLMQRLTELVEEKQRDGVILTLLETTTTRPPKLSACRHLARLLDGRLLDWYAARDKAVAHKAMTLLRRLWGVEDPSELVGSVALVQRGVVKWLLDEDGCASDVEYTEMVKHVFIPVLDRLATLQSSIPHSLTVLEPLLASVFQKPIFLGADAFVEFYRKCSREQPQFKSMCPERLHAAAKCYADLCAEPLEDSNSVMAPTSPSTVISDSQSPVSPRKRSLRHEYSHFEDFADMVGFGFQVGGDSRGRSSASEVAATPKATISRRQPRSVRRCSSVGAGSSGSMAGSSANTPQGSPEVPVVPVRRMLKRHHTEGAFVSSGEHMDRVDGAGPSRPLKRAKTLSGPMLPPAAPIRLSSPSRRPGSSRMPPTNSPLPPSSDPEGEDDYDSWEAGISHKDIQTLRDELNVQVDSGAEEGQFDDADSDLVLGSPAPVNDFPFRSRCRRRSQTAPEPSPQSPLLNADEPFAQHALRRHRTSGSLESDENIQINAVRHAYAAVVESDGVSQMGVEDLLQLKRLASRIGQTVDDQLEHQLEKEGKVGGGRGKGRGKARAYGDGRSQSPL